MALSYPRPGCAIAFKHRTDTFLSLARSSVDNHNPANIGLEGYHGNADASVLAALHRAHDLRGRDRIAARTRYRRPQGVRHHRRTAADLRRSHLARRPRSPAEEPRDPAQLSDIS